MNVLLQDKTPSNTDTLAYFGTQRNLLRLRAKIGQTTRLYWSFDFHHEHS